MEVFTNNFQNFNLISYIMGFISALIIALINHKLAKRRDLRHHIIDTFKLSSELMNEINLFLKSQRHFCEHHEEYNIRSYYGHGFEPIENIDNLINLESKSFLDFFDKSWLDKFYHFFALSQITHKDLFNNLKQLRSMIEDIYPKREIATLNDEYDEFYHYIDMELKVKFEAIHSSIQKKL